jgi:hypothetical protein
MLALLNGVFAEPWDLLRPGIDATQSLRLPIGLLVLLVSLVLLAIAVMAYRKNRTEKLKLVCLAFGLFSVKLLANVVDLVASPGYFMGPPVQNIFDLAILATLFVALFRRK